MSMAIERSPTMQQHRLNQSTVCGSVTRKRSWEQMQDAKNLLLSTPAHQKKGSFVAVYAQI